VLNAPGVTMIGHHNLCNDSALGLSTMLNSKKHRWIKDGVCGYSKFAQSGAISWSVTLPLVGAPKPIHRAYLDSTSGPEATKDSVSATLAGTPDSYLPSGLLSFLASAFPRLTFATSIRLSLLANISLSPPCPTSQL
jgi:hypothetical protein